MGPCGGPPKTIRQRYIILNYSVRGVGGYKSVTFGQKWGRKLEHGEFFLFSGQNYAFLAIFDKL